MKKTLSLATLLVLLMSLVTMPALADVRPEDTPPEALISDNLNSSYVTWINPAPETRTADLKIIALSAGISKTGSSSVSGSILISTNEAADIYGALTVQQYKDGAWHGIETKISLAFNESSANWTKSFSVESNYYYRIKGHGMAEQSGGFTATRTAYTKSILVN